MEMTKSEIIINCAEIFYYKINPNSKMDVPSFVYEQMEKLYNYWEKEGKPHNSFKEYCDVVYSRHKDNNNK